MHYYSNFNPYRNKYQVKILPQTLWSFAVYQIHNKSTTKKNPVAKYFSMLLLPLLLYCQIFLSFSLVEETRVTLPQEALPSKKSGTFPRTYCKKQSWRSLSALTKINSGHSPYQAMLKSGDEATIKLYTYSSQNKILQEQPQAFYAIVPLFHHNIPNLIVPSRCNRFPVIY